MVINMAMKMKLAAAEADFHWGYVACAAICVPAPRYFYTMWLSVYTP